MKQKLKLKNAKTQKQKIHKHTKGSSWEFTRFFKKQNKEDLKPFFAGAGWEETQTVGVGFFFVCFKLSPGVVWGGRSALGDHRPLP